MKIGIATDHRGVDLKQKLIIFLTEKGYNVVDYGTNSSDSVDYPDYAFKVGEAVRDKKIDQGILICGTGIGMSIALNKMKDIYCAKVSTNSEAALAKSHNNANALALSTKAFNSFLL